MRKETAQQRLQNNAVPIDHLYEFNVKYQVMFEHVPEPTWAGAKQFKPETVHQVKLNEWFVESGDPRSKEYKGYLVRRVLIDALRTSDKDKYFRWHCECIDFNKNRIHSSKFPYCKHIYAVYRDYHTGVNAWVNLARLSRAGAFLENHLKQYPELLEYLHVDMPEIYDFLGGPTGVAKITGVPQQEAMQFMATSDLRHILSGGNLTMREAEEALRKFNTAYLSMKKLY